jgi:type IV pilus assembly protein PilO
MNPIIQNILDRPRGQKIGIWVGSLVFVALIFWQYFYGPGTKELGKLETKIEDLNSQIGHEQRLARNLVKFRKEVKELEVKLKLALQELPDEKEIPDLLNNISNLARDAGLEVALFKPNPEVFREFYAEVPVTVSVEGTFHQVATFFDEVGRLPRIVNVNQIYVRDPKQPEGEEQMRIKSDCTATTFRYLDESQRIDAPDAADKKKRRKK